jgi:hypothetical protein
LSYSSCLQVAAHNLEHCSCVILPATFILFIIIYFSAYLATLTKLNADGYKMVPIMQTNGEYQSDADYYDYV